MPIAVKDLIDTADMPTEYGSPIYRGHRPTADAACVALARAAGAVVLGKTVTTEFATFSPGKTANPHNPAHTPGGSSSGSAAAVADGMAPLAFGSQTAGSVIRPASFCGVVGYKPSFGLIGRAGVKPLADSLDTVGVMARNVADAAFFAGVLTERPALRHLAMPRQAPRFGLYRTPMWAEAEPATVAALDRARAALDDAGAAVEELAIAPEHQGLTEAQDRIMGFELSRALAWERIRHSAELSPPLAQLLDAGMAVGAAEYDAALAEADFARAGLDRFFGRCDAVLVPAAPGEAPAGLGYTGDPVFNRMWTLARRAVRDGAGGLRSGRAADRGPARREAAGRRPADGGGGLPRARARRGIMRAGRIAALAFAAALTGCTALDPYPTYPRQPAAGTARSRAAGGDLLRYLGELRRRGAEGGAGRVCAEHARQARRYRFAAAILPVAAAGARHLRVRTTEQ